MLVIVAGVFVVLGEGNLDGPRRSATTSFVEPPLLSPLRLLLILLLDL